MENIRKFQPILVWGTSNLYFILAVTVTLMFAVLSPDLKNQLNLSSAQLGFLSFAFFLSFGLTQLLAGSLIDTWGPRFALTLAACIAAGGLALLSFAQNFTQAFLAQIIAGGGFSISYVGTIYLASKWFSQKKFPMMAGLTLMSANLISATLIAMMAVMGVVDVPYRKITFALAIVVLVLAVLLFMIVRQPDSSVQRNKSLFWEDLYKLFHIPQFWLGAIYFTATISVYLAFSSLWNIPESLAFGHNLKTATFMSATLRFGCALGAFLAGTLASYAIKKSALMRTYASGALLMILILNYGPVFPTALVFILFALLGFFFGGAALGFPFVEQFIPTTLRGTGFGLMAAFGYLLCALLQYLTGMILNFEIPSGTPSPHEYRIALTPLAIILGIGWLCSFWLSDGDHIKD